jgi:pyochelin biosynthesis protein PchC
MISGVVKQVTCPLCGGIVESGSPEKLIELARRHTMAAHGYDVPAEHVIAAMEDADQVS